MHQTEFQLIEWTFNTLAATLCLFLDARHCLGLSLDIIPYIGFYAWFFNSGCEANINFFCVALDGKSVIIFSIF